MSYSIFTRLLMLLIPKGQRGDLQVQYLSQISAFSSKRSTPVCHLYRKGITGPESLEVGTEDYLMDQKSDPQGQQVGIFAGHAITKQLCDQQNLKHSCWTVRAFWRKAIRITNRELRIQNTPRIQAIFSGFDRKYIENGWGSERQKNGIIVYYMCLLAGCIVIDEFTLRLSHAVYILTHWHSDHYRGLTQSWSFGPIFTSAITRQLLLTKYPKLHDQVRVLPLRKWTAISSEIEVLSFDSNHMAGSIMVLVRVESKYYLHTGDMRFSPKIAANTPEVFSGIQSSGTKKEYRCLFQIEELHLDNTFCDPIFKFPKRSQAIRMLTELVAELKPSRLFICTDSVGKEEAFLIISRYYQAKIAVTSNRLEYIKAMGLPYQTFFTTNAEETWIEVIPKAEKQSRIVNSKGSIGVTLTGWANLTHAYPDGYNSYFIPYSLHSNFRQMELLVKWVRPRRLIGVVKEAEGKWSKISKSNNYRGYVFSLTGIKQRGMDFLRQEYCGEKDQQIVWQKKDIEANNDQS